MSSVMPPFAILDEIKVLEGKCFKYHERLEELKRDTTREPMKMLQNKREKALIMKLKKDFREKIFSFEADFCKATGGKKAPKFILGTKPVQDSSEKQEEAVERRLRQVKIIFSKDDAKLEELVSKRKSASSEEKKKIENDIAALEEKSCMLYVEWKKQMKWLEALKRRK